MPNGNRQDQHQPQRGDRRPRRGGGPGGGGGGGGLLALTIENVVFDATAKTLTASAVATRGNSTVPATAVRFFVDGSPMGDQMHTDGSGRAFLVLRNVEYAGGSHAVRVNAIAVNVTATAMFLVPRLGEGRDAVSIEVTHGYIQTREGFDVTLDVTAKRGEQPLANRTVEIEFLDQIVARMTDQNGKARTVITVLNPDRLTKQVVEVRVILPDDGITAETQKLLELEWKERKPARVTRGRPGQIEPGRWRVRFTAEDDDQRGLPGVLIAITGGPTTIEQTTDNRGVAEFELACLEDRDITEFDVDVSGIRESDTLQLLGKKVKRGKEVQTELRFPAEATFWQHFRQGARVSAKKVVLREEERP